MELSSKNTWVSYQCSCDLSCYMKAVASPYKKSPPLTCAWDANMDAEKGSKPDRVPICGLKCYERY